MTILLKVSSWLQLLSLKNVILITIILAVSVALSLSAQQYYSNASFQIERLARQDIVSNAQIEAYAIAKSLSSRIDRIGNNLAILVSSPLIQSSDLDGRDIIDAAQVSSKDITEGYIWLDENGRTVAFSIIGIENPFGNVSDHTMREYFQVTKQSRQPHMTAIIQSNDGDETETKPRMFISYPILDRVSGQFKGVMVASINAVDIGTTMSDILPDQFKSDAGLMDINGIILYSNNQTYIGRNFFGDEFQAILPEVIRNDFNEIIRTSLSGNAGVSDFAFGGNTSTIAYQPVIVNGDHLWTVYVVYTHNFADDVLKLIDQQRTFGTLIVAVIAAAAIVTGIIAMSWNHRLGKVVQQKTAEILTSNKKLEEANTKLIAANKQLGKANEQLKVHDRLQKEFINIAAHEMRTPVQPILVASEMLEEDLNDSDSKERKEEIKMIARNARRLKRLIDDILDVARIESQSLKLNKSKFNLDNTLKAIVEEARKRNENVNVDIQYQPRNIFIYGDEHRISQVISNLLNNALRFTQSGRISIVSESDNVNVTVKIEDTGKGIDEDMRPKLFTKFATKSGVGGTGLGLYISKSIVEAHGGRIWAENNGGINNGGGATFAFTLPHVNDQQNDSIQKDLRLTTTSKTQGDK